MDRAAFLSELRRRYGSARQLNGSRSIFELAGGDAVVYLRYSKTHAGRGGFYGLRAIDLERLTGRPAVVAFITDDGEAPVMLPMDSFAATFKASPVAADGQVKAQLKVTDAGPQLFLPRAGRYDVGAYVGWGPLEELTEGSVPVPVLSHADVQTLLGGIGKQRGFDVWIPLHDRSQLNWELARRFECRRTIPPAPSDVQSVLQTIDVLWLRPGTDHLAGVFEVEHSTPIYSGLLRFNDLKLVGPTTERFDIVSNDERREAFVRQVSRPTFRASGLADMCGFLEYDEVFRWHARLAGI